MDKERILQNHVIAEYKMVMMDALKYSFPILKREELSDAIDYTILKYTKNGKAYLDNNYKKKQLNGTVLDVLDYIMKMEPIVTSSGVLFKQHKDIDNPLAKMIMGFLDLRAKHKKTMYKFPKGSEQFARYNLLQLLCKLDANAVYGVLGNCSSMFYNIYVAEAVTRQGRSYISCSIMLFESFLANNVKFNSLNEVITFIHNIVGEKDRRKYEDSMFLDRNIELEECFIKVMNTVDMTIWIPTEKEMGLVWEYLQGVSQEDLNRIYYKNNLYEFCDLNPVSDLLIKILCKLESPFINPNKPPKEIKNDLEILVDMIKEYVYYQYLYIDKLDRIEYMQRDIVIITDTDSTIISFDAWYRFLLEKTYAIDMPIKHKMYEMVHLIKEDEFGDKPLRQMCHLVEPQYDYDFYTDEVMELERSIYMGKFITQDSLKFSIINIIAYVCSDLVVDYLEMYSKHSGSYSEGVKCRMIMKNEFYFLKALLTPHRKNYADLQFLQEGNIVPESERMAIVGLPINKSTLSEDIKLELQKILYNDILTSDNIDQIAILKKLVILEKNIYNSIMNKEIKYYRPDNVGSISNYAKPLEINGILAEMVYNALRDEDMPEINMEERNKIIKIKLDIDKKKAVKIKDDYPDTFEKLIKLLDHPTIGSKVNTIGLPLDIPVPDWILPFVDVTSIINDALKNFPIDSIGLKRYENDNVNYTNIIDL